MTIRHSSSTNADKILKNMVFYLLFVKLMITFAALNEKTEAFDYSDNNARNH